MSQKTPEVGEKIAKINEVKDKKVGIMTDLSTEKNYDDSEKKNEVLSNHSDTDN